MDFAKPKDGQKIHGDTNFTPAYTYYDWGHQPGVMPEQSGKEKEDD